MDALWQEYAQVFRDWDDLTLARWMAQTLGQLKGRVWRMSHPLVGTYRLAAQAAQSRQIWHKRLVTLPSPYILSPCCRAPFLPLITRDVKESGLICQHCNEPLLAFEDLPTELQPATSAWAEQYVPFHAVAHWDDRQRRLVQNYDDACEEAALGVEKLFIQAHQHLYPLFLDHYPTLIWEDQDECLDVQPEDITFSP